MNSMKSVFSIFFLILVFSLNFTVEAFGDMLWEIEETTKGSKDKKGKSLYAKHYTKGSFYRIDRGSRTQLIDLDKGIIYDIDHTNRSVIKNTVGASSKKSKTNENNAALANAMKKMMKKIEVTRTNEKKTIKGYPCVKYTVSFMTRESEYWVSKKMDGYDELKAVKEKSAKIFNISPYFKQINVDAINGIDGFPVHTVMRVMGNTVTSVLKQMKKGALDASLFVLPKGYTIKSRK